MAKPKKSKYEETLAKIQNNNNNASVKKEANAPIKSGTITHGALAGNTGSRATTTPSTTIAKPTVTTGKKKNSNKYDSVLNKLNARYDASAPVDDLYINTFFEDAQDFLSRSASTVSGMSWTGATSKSVYNNWKTEYDSMKDKEKRIRQYLDANKNSINPSSYKELVSGLDQFHWSGIDARLSFDKADKYFSQWDSEADYTKWKKESVEQERLRNVDVWSSEREIKDLEDLLNEYKFHSRIMTNEDGAARLRYIEQNYGDEDAIKALITKKQQELNLARRIQESDRLISVGDKNSKNYDPEFSYWSKTRTKVPTAQELENYDIMTDASTWQVGDDGKLRDAFGTEIDTTKRDANGKVLHPSAGSVDATDRLGIYLSAKDDSVEYSVAENRFGTLDKILAEGDSRHWDRLTQDQIDTYYYYLNKSGAEEANRYLDLVQDSVNIQVGQEIYNKIGDSKALKTLFGISAGLDQWSSSIGGLGRELRGDNDYVAPSATQYAGSRARQDLDGALGVAYDAASTISNMAPSFLTGMLANALVPGAGFVGSVMMGAGASGSAYDQMINEGYSVDQARTYGALVGASEVALESLLGGISEFGGGALSKGITKAMSAADNALLKLAVNAGNTKAGRIITSMISEGEEEGLQEILSTWLKNMITHSDEDINWEEVGYSTLLGALTGGVFEAPSVALDSIIDNAELRGVGKTIVETEGGVDALKALAIDLSGSQSKLGKLAEKTISEPVKGEGFTGKAKAFFKNVSNNRRVGKLYEAVKTEVTKQNRSDIATALGEKGFSATSAKNIAEAIAARINGEELDKFQQMVLDEVKDNKTVNDVVTNVINDDASNVVKRTSDLNAYRYGVATGKAIAPTETAKPQFDVSDEGKTILHKADGSARDVEVKRVSKIENGKVSLELSDGSVVDANDVSFASNGEAWTYSVLAEIGADVEQANTLLAAYNGNTELDRVAYARGVQEAYRYGSIGIPLSKISESGFAARMSESARTYAYNMGAMQGIRNASIKQQNLAQKKIKPQRYHESFVQERNGVKYDDVDINAEKLNARQKTGIQLAEFLASLGMDVHVFKSKQVNGVFVGENGTYRLSDGSIHVDLNAGAKGEGLVAYTLSHETTHFIKDWSPEKYKTFAEALFEEVGKTDASIDGMVANTLERIRGMKEYKGKTEDELWDIAYDEVVAEMCETMLTDTDAAVKIVERIKKTDSELLNKIIEFFDNLLTKLKNVLKANVAYKDSSPDSIIAQQALDTLKNVERLRDLFADALVDATDSFRSSEQVLAQAGIEVNAETDSGSLQSVRFVLDEAERKKTAKALAERFKVTEKEAMEWLKAETSLASLILNPKYSQFLDYEADPNEVAIKQNSDYPQGTVDFSNICKKRREFTQVMNRILRNFPNHVFAATDLAKIRTIMGEEGMTLPCGICYVEDRRQLDTIVAQDFINGLQLYREGSKTRPDGKPFNTNQLKGLQLTDGDTYVPTIYELVTLEGRNTPKEKNPNMEAAWVKYNNARGMQAVRLLTNEAEYKRQILKYNKKTVQSKNDHGGLRIYSFSDMEMFHLIDIIQVITDSATVGLSIQGYTKVNEYAKAVKDTGEKLNRSLIPKGDLGYHMENGKIVLDYDPVEGIDIYSEDFFDSKDNPNVGNITIGINDTQIRAAMVSDFVDYIIPFHTGQSEEVLGEKGIAAWENYKDYQTEKDLSTGKTSSHQINIYTEVFQAAEEEGKPIQNKRQFVEKFLQVCKENGLQPRFSQFLNVDSEGNYVYTEGYHKFLVDFKTFAQTEVGEYLPQMPVKPIFDDAYITSLLEAYVTEQQAKDAEVAKQMPNVIERITNEIVKPEQGEVRKSSRYTPEELFAKKPLAVATFPVKEVPTKRKKVNLPEVVKEAKKGTGSIVYSFNKGPQIVQSYVYIPDIESNVLLNTQGIVHGLQGRITNSSTMSTAEVEVVLPEILRNSISVNELSPRDEDQAKGIKKSYVLFGYAKRLDGQEYLVRSTINHFDDNKSLAESIQIFDVLKGTKAKKMDSGVIGSHNEQSSARHLNTTKSIYTISVEDLLENVKNNYPEFLPDALRDYYGVDAPKEKGLRFSTRDSAGKTLSKDQQSYFANSVVRDAAGNLMVMYHGTANGGAFTIFDGNKLGNEARTTQIGQGFYFTNDKKEAKSYTANVDIYGRRSKGKNPHLHQVYLNITNPFNVSEDTLNLDDVKAVYGDGTYTYFFDNWIPFYLNKKSVNGEILTETAVQAMSRKEKVSLYVDYLARLGTKELLSNMVRAFPYGKQSELLASMQNRMGYDGIVEEFAPGKYQYVAFSAEQIKSTDNANPTVNPDIRYSDRSTDSVSNRTLLADALESTAQHEVERKKLQEYKSKISEMEAQERKLSELNEQIKELSFGKGARDKEKLSKLKAEKTKTQNRINIYDKQLLQLESTKALKNVLEREKQKAYKRAEAKGKEALEAYRKATTERYERYAQKQAEKRQESLAKYRDSKKRTELRHKIQRVVNELNDLLINETKKRHVPDNLKKAVADALSLVNMDTVGAEERIAKYQSLIAKERAKAEPDQEKIDSYINTMDNIRSKGEKMGQRLKELRDAYEEIQQSSDPDIANAYDPVIAGAIKELAETIGDTSIKDMSADQLSDVYDVYRMVLTRVRDANKALIDNIKESIERVATSVISEVRSAGGEHSKRVAMLDPARKFMWNNMKPVYAMEYIGSSALTKVFNNVRAGEDVWAEDVRDARAYYRAMAKKYGYDDWDFDKKHSFASVSGETFELSLGQMLSLYAYSKREQAHDHLRLGGFVFDSNIETIGEKGSKLVKYKVNTADSHQIGPETLADIVTSLTSEQLGYVDAMQDYLSTVMGAKGNEVTSKMYGVKLFKEKFYFPLKSAKQFMFEQNEVAGEVRIKNSGFTNKVVAKANNPVILRNFMDVWTGHVNDMSMYHAFTLPLEDFNRVFNYQTPKAEGQSPVSVKGTIQNAYSPAAVNYVKQLITDLNGGARTDPATDLPNKLMGMFKKGAVFASLSVVVQQPSAIARAAALVDTKYFIGPKVDHKRHKALWDEVKKYAPVATIKEMGYFDTNMGLSTNEYIQSKEYEGMKAKIEAFLKDGSYRDEVLSIAPALADEIAWCGIWEAVKRETKAKHPGLDVKSEPFLMLCGSRFTEVITKTQVYDSVLSRSGNMRSKDTVMKMATAFMAEPTTSINMIMDALIQGKRGNHKYARHTIGAVVAAQVLNSILVSFVYAARDDDEDETYWGKYIESFIGNVIDGLNPLTYIPFIKDIISIVQGYDVERSDMSVISDMWRAIQNLTNDKVSAWKKVEDFAGSICQFFGLPVKNIMRDVRGIYQTIKLAIVGEKATNAGYGYAAKAGLPKWMGGGAVSNEEQLYRATLNGDTEHLARVKGRYTTEKKVQTAMRSAIKDHYLKGDIDASTAQKYLTMYTDDDESEAYWKVEEWRHDAQFEEEFGKYNEFYEAVRTGKNLKATIQKYIENGVSEDTLRSQISDYFKEKYIKMSTAEKANIKGYLLNAMTVLGNTRSEAEQKIKNWEFEQASGFSYENRREEYLEGNITEDQLREAVNEYGGLSNSETEDYIEDIKFEEEYGFKYADRDELYKDGTLSKEALREILMSHGGLSDEEANAEIADIEFEMEYGFRYSNRNQAYKRGDITREELYEHLTTYGEKTPDEANKAIAAVDFEIKYGYTYANRVDAYKDGAITEAEMRNALAENSDMDDTEIDNTIRAYNWMRDNSQYDLTVTDVLAYTKPIEKLGTSIEDSGIDPNTFVQYRELRTECKGVDSDGDGTADRNSVKNEVLAVINSLPISSSQKDALYYQNGWAASKIGQAPWH